MITGQSAQKTQYFTTVQQQRNTTASNTH